MGGASAVKERSSDSSACNGYGATSVSSQAPTVFDYNQSAWPGPATTAGNAFVTPNRIIRDGSVTEICRQAGQGRQ